MVQYTKKKFLYIVCAILSLCVLLTTSVYAVEEYMKLKLYFYVSPAVSCTVEIKVKDVSGTNVYSSYYTVFSNSTSENINSNITRRIKGTTISLGGGIFSNLEVNDEIMIKITNNSLDTTKTMSVNISNQSSEGAILDFDGAQSVTSSGIVANNGTAEIEGVVQNITVSRLNLTFKFYSNNVTP